MKVKTEIKAGAITGITFNLGLGQSSTAVLGGPGAAVAINVGVVEGISVLPGLSINVKA